MKIKNIAKIITIGYIAALYACSTNNAILRMEPYSSSNSEQNEEISTKNEKIMNNRYNELMEILISEIYMKDIILKLFNKNSENKYEAAKIEAGTLTSIDLHWKYIINCIKDILDNDLAKVLVFNISELFYQYEYINNQDKNDEENYVLEILKDASKFIEDFFQFLDLFKNKFKDFTLKLEFNFGSHYLYAIRNEEFKKKEIKTLCENYHNLCISNLENILNKNVISSIIMYSMNSEEKLMSEIFELLDRSQTTSINELEFIICRDINNKDSELIRKVVQKISPAKFDFFYNTSRSNNYLQKILKNVLSINCNLLSLIVYYKSEKEDNAGIVDWIDIALNNKNIKELDITINTFVSEKLNPLYDKIKQLLEKNIINSLNIRDDNSDSNSDSDDNSIKKQIETDSKKKQIETDSKEFSYKIIKTLLSGEIKNSSLKKISLPIFSKSSKNNSFESSCIKGLIEILTNYNTTNTEKFTKSFEINIKMNPHSDKYINEYINYILNNNVKECYLKYISEFALQEIGPFAIIVNHHEYEPEFLLKSIVTNNIKIFFENYSISVCVDTKIKKKNEEFFNKFQSEKITINNINILLLNYYTTGILSFKDESVCEGLEQKKTIEKNENRPKKFFHRVPKGRQRSI